MVLFEVHLVSGGQGTLQIYDNCRYDEGTLVQIRKQPLFSHI
jgi:hypothetical protein